MGYKLFPQPSPPHFPPKLLLKNIWTLSSFLLLQTVSNRHLNSEHFETDSCPIDWYFCLLEHGTLLFRDICRASAHNRQQWGSSGGHVCGRPLAPQFSAGAGRDLRAQGEQNLLKPWEEGSMQVKLSRELCVTPFVEQIIREEPSWHIGCGLQCSPWGPGRCVPPSA